MSKSVTIPSTNSPMWTCCINGTCYSYSAGSTQTVPDEVAALINDIRALDPREAPEDGTAGQIWTKQATGARWADLPKGVSVADAAGSAPTAEEFNALLASLRNAGFIEVSTNGNS